MKFPKLHKFNDMYTPPEALNYITPFLSTRYTYWEACWGRGHMANELSKRGYFVVGNPDIDCLTQEPEVTWDIWITNPPFSNNKTFIERAINLGKPFAFLLRLEHLGGKKAFELLHNFDFQIIIPKRRINYITPKMLEGEKVGGAQYHSIWLTHELHLPKQITYYEV